MKKQILFVLLCFLLAAPISANAEKLISHPWAGKCVGYIGDSIMDPLNKASKDKWWQLLSEWLDIRPVCFAKSGRQWNDVVRQAKLIQDSVGDSVDAIIISLGTNDFNAAVPLGNWYHERQERVLAAVHRPKAMELRWRRTPDCNDSTFRGRINTALSTLKKMYPTKQIVLLTPIHRAFFYGGEKNIQPTEQYQNDCGRYFSEYVEAIKEAGNIWSVPVIDMNALSGLYPLFDEDTVYFHNAEKDRLHPNDKGQRRFALTLMQQLISLPCNF